MAGPIIQFAAVYGTHLSNIGACSIACNVERKGRVVGVESRTFSATVIEESSEGNSSCCMFLALSYSEETSFGVSAVLSGVVFEAVQNKSWEI